MNTTPALPRDSDILSHAVEEFDHEQMLAVAELLSKLRLPTSDLDRVDALLDKKNNAQLTPVEEAELDSFLRVGGFLDMLRARALRILAEERD